MLIASLAGAGIAQEVPAGYRKVYMTSMVNTKFVIQAKAPVKAGTTTVVQQAANTVAQQWILKSGTGSKIQLANTTLCMDGGPKANWKDMGKIYLNNCSDTEAAQKWNVMADGRISLEAFPSECIDLVYMRATAGNDVGLYACAGLGNTGAKDKGINWPLVNVTTF